MATTESLRRLVKEISGDGTAQNGYRWHVLSLEKRDQRPYVYYFFGLDHLIPLILPVGSASHR
jgi:hypothetical protein